ncbi:MAG: YtxH domain-containing protein [Bacteroidales bacterium]|nr:YtxH domain-containing protein [Bacteroidales bacterium]
MNSEKIILGVLAGLAVGVILGVLFAPKKGSVTRDKIAGKIADLTDELKDKYEDILTGFVQKIDTVKENMSDVYLHQNKKD